MGKQDRHANLADLVRRSAIKDDGADALRTSLAQANRSGSGGSLNGGAQKKYTRTDRIAKRGVLVHLRPQVHQELKVLAKSRGMSLQGMVRLELERIAKKAAQARRRAERAEPIEPQAPLAEA